MYPGNDIQGWMRPEELQWLYEMACRMASVVEIGSWKGRSTHALLSAGARVVAVDNWKTIIQKHDPARAEMAFKANLAAFAKLSVLKLESLDAARQFRRRSVDMVFIDGTHTYEAVLADIQTWLPKARKLICGHDYKPSWPGVQQAVREVFGKDFGVFKGIWFHHCTPQGGAA
jgi:hypothetical protein